MDYRKSPESMNKNIPFNHLTTDLAKARTELIPQIADYNCLPDADRPAERVRLERLSDLDFQEEALRYLDDSIRSAEGHLEALRYKKSVFVEEPAAKALRCPRVYYSLAPVLIAAIKSGSDQGLAIAGIVWSLYADEMQVCLREALEKLDAPNAEAVAALISIYAALGARAKPLVGHILRDSKAEIPSRGCGAPWCSWMR